MTDRTHPDSGRTTGGIVEMLQDRVAELEAQLESIGAGGVSPLIGQPQAMPDLTALTERGAKAWAGVDAQGLREGFTAADMATAESRGFRDGVASLSANAGEPVAWLYESPMPDGSVFTGASAERLQVGVGTPPGTIEKPLYLAAPPTAQAEAENLRKALQFYADKEHFAIAEEGAWDTVSGEPQNYWCDEAGTAMVEDGSIAKMALAGQLINFSDEDEDESAPPTSAEGVEHG